MNGFIKLAGLGLILTLGATAAYDLPVRKLEAAVGKLQDRLPASSENAASDSSPELTTGSIRTRPARGKGDRLGGPADLCRTKPPMAVTCMAGGASGRTSVTVETREAGNVSVLTRGPAG